MKMLILIFSLFLTAFSLAEKAFASYSCEALFIEQAPKVNHNAPATDFIKSVQLFYELTKTTDRKQVLNQKNRFFDFSLEWMKESILEKISPEFDYNAFIEGHDIDVPSAKNKLKSREEYVGNLEKFLPTIEAYIKSGISYKEYIDVSTLFVRAISNYNSVDGLDPFQNFQGLNNYSYFLDSAPPLFIFPTPRKLTVQEINEVSDLPVFFVGLTNTPLKFDGIFFDISPRGFFTHDLVHANEQIKVWPENIRSAVTKLVTPQGPEIRPFSEETNEYVKSLRNLNLYIRERTQLKNLILNSGDVKSKKLTEAVHVLFFYMTHEDHGGRYVPLERTAILDFLRSDEFEEKYIHELLNRINDSVDLRGTITEDPNDVNGSVNDTNNEFWLRKAAEFIINQLTP